MVLKEEKIDNVKFVVVPEAELVRDHSKAARHPPRDENTLEIRLGSRGRCERNFILWFGDVAGDKREN
jgi:hypothetical protein